MLDRMGVADAAIELITYVTLGCVVVLAGLIVFNELRAAGSWVDGALRATPVESGDGARCASRPDMAGCGAAALMERPRLLLELIAAKLTDLKRLPPAGAFTVRELTRAAKLREESRSLTAVGAGAHRRARAIRDEWHRALDGGPGGGEWPCLAHESRTPEPGATAGAKS